MGYSWFPQEIAPVPKSWAATTGKLVWSNHHNKVCEALLITPYYANGLGIKGGHFAALEQPDALLSDIEAFLKQTWNEA